MRVKCSVCGRTKAPWGRDVAPAAHGSYCTHDDCEGYRLGEQPGTLWWNEEREERMKREGEEP